MFSIDHPEAPLPQKVSSCDDIGFVYNMHSREMPGG